MLLKVVLFAYSQGILSSRGIERACREHVIFVALSGESCAHFTTIADFVSSSGEASIVPVETRRPRRGAPMVVRRSRTGG
jgi:hypothetical protein